MRRKPEMLLLISVAKDGRMHELVGEIITKLVILTLKLANIIFPCTSFLLCLKKALEGHNPFCNDFDK